MVALVSSCLALVGSSAVLCYSLQDKCAKSENRDADALDAHKASRLEEGRSRTTLFADKAGEREAAVTFMLYSNRKFMVSVQSQSSYMDIFL